MVKPSFLGVLCLVALSRGFSLDCNYVEGGKFLLKKSVDGGQLSLYSSPPSSPSLPPPPPPLW